eukprot:3357949-Rhodomonas_salina.1
MACQEEQHVVQRALRDDGGIGAGLLRILTLPAFGWASRTSGLIEKFDVVYDVTLLGSMVVPRYSFFILAFVVVAFALAETIFVARIFEAGSVKQMWPVKVLRFLVVMMVTTLFSSLVKWLLIPLSCLVSDEASFSEAIHGEGTACDPFRLPEILATVPTIPAGQPSFTRASVGEHWPCGDPFPRQQSGSNVPRAPLPPCFSDRCGRNPAADLAVRVLAARQHSSIPSPTHQPTSRRDLRVDLMGRAELHHRLDQQLALAPVDAHRAAACHVPRGHVVCAEHARTAARVAGPHARRVGAAPVPRRAPAHRQR